MAAAMAAAASTASTNLTERQLSKFGQLWTQWHATHEAATAALSSAVNIHERLQEDLIDPAAFPTAATAATAGNPAQQQHEQHQQQQQQQQLHSLVVSKQLASMDRALCVLRGHHEQLQQVVRDMERLHMEASRALSNIRGRALAAAAAPPAGPQPSLLQVVEAMQDAWVMCRDELLLKVAVLGLVSLDATPHHMATLLNCYRDQPNLQQGSSRVEAVLTLLRETATQQDKR